MDNETSDLYFYLRNKDIAETDISNILGHARSQFWKLRKQATTDIEMACVGV